VADVAGIQLLEVKYGLDFGHEIIVVSQWPNSLPQFDSLHKKQRELSAHDVRSTSSGLYLALAAFLAAGVFFVAGFFSVFDATGLEFKLEAVRLVAADQAVPVTAKILGVPVQTLGNWARFSEKGLLKDADDKPVSAEQMELARLRTELARVKIARDNLKKRQRTSLGNPCEVRLGR
jgi:transposase